MLRRLILLVAGVSLTMVGVSTPASAGDSFPSRSMEIRVTDFTRIPVGGNSYSVSITVRWQKDPHAGFYSIAVGDLTNGGGSSLATSQSQKSFTFDMGVLPAGTSLRIQGSACTADVSVCTASNVIGLSV